MSDIKRYLAGETSELPHPNPFLVGGYEPGAGLVDQDLVPRNSDGTIAYSSEFPRIVGPGYFPRRPRRAPISIPSWTELERCFPDMGIREPKIGSAMFYDDTFVHYFRKTKDIYEAREYNQFPPLKLPLFRQMQFYAQQWAAWVYDLEDDIRRNELFNWVTLRMQESWVFAMQHGFCAEPTGHGPRCCLSHGPDDRCAANDNEEEAPKQTRKRNVDNSIRQAPFASESRLSHGIINKELEEVSVTMEEIEQQVAFGVEAGEALLKNMTQLLDHRALELSDWTTSVSRSSQYNPRTHTRNLLMYCLWEVQRCRNVIDSLESSASHYKSTPKRIGTNQQRLSQHLALAIELNRRNTIELDDADDEESSESDEESRRSTHPKAKASSIVDITSETEAEAEIIRSSTEVASPQRVGRNVSSFDGANDEEPSTSSTAILGDPEEKKRFIAIYWQERVNGWLSEMSHPRLSAPLQNWTGIKDVLETTGKCKEERNELLQEFRKGWEEYSIRNASMKAMSINNSDVRESQLCRQSQGREAVGKTTDDDIPHAQQRPKSDYNFVSHPVIQQPPVQKTGFVNMQDVQPYPSQADQQYPPSGSPFNTFGHIRQYPAVASQYPRPFASQNPPVPNASNNSAVQPPSNEILELWTGFLSCYMPHTTLEEQRAAKDMIIEYATWITESPLKTTRWGFYAVFVSPYTGKEIAHGFWNAKGSRRPNDSGWFFSQDTRPPGFREIEKVVTHNWGYSIPPIKARKPSKAFKVGTKRGRSPTSFDQEWTIPYVPRPDKPTSGNSNKKRKRSNNFDGSFDCDDSDEEWRPDA